MMPSNDFLPDTTYGELHARHERARRRRKRRRAALVLLPVLALLAVAAWQLTQLERPRDLTYLETLALPAWVDVQLLDVGEARRGALLDGLDNIVVHYVGNPGTTAQQNHDYFGNPGTNVCSHFIVCLDGAVIQCVPLREQSAASNQVNHNSISIEVCHPDESGQFTDATYAAVVDLCAWLCEACDLTADDIIRHYDVTGKECPAYYVAHADAWEELRGDVDAQLREE